jgi:predicted RNase H-like nuclease (RuvC/YqgF family)
VGTAVYRLESIAKGRKMADPDWDSSEDMDAEDQQRTIEKLEAENRRLVRENQELLSEQNRLMDERLKLEAELRRLKTIILATERK